MMISEDEIKETLNWILSVSTIGYEVLYHRPKIYQSNSTAKMQLRSCKDEINTVHTYYSDNSDIMKAKTEEILHFFETEYHLLRIKLKDAVHFGDERRKINLKDNLDQLNQIGTPFLFKYSKIIEKLADKYSAYQIGQKITEKSIGIWLTQFRDEENMRLALSLLKAIEIVRDEEIIEAYKNSIPNIICGIKSELILTQLVTMLESMPGMEHTFSKAFERLGKELGIRQTCDDIKLLLREDYKDKTLLFVDDFIGSGNQQRCFFKELFDEPQNGKVKYIKRGKRLTEEEIKIFKLIEGYIMAYHILPDGEDTLNKYFSENGLKLKLIKASGRTLTKCFESNIGPNGEYIFCSDSDREKARELCSEIGFYLRNDLKDEKIRKRDALGYRNSQQLIVFSHGTPNNTLPIFWKKGCYKDQPWIPLFPRPEE